MSNVDLYRAENCLDVIDGLYKHHEHANFLISEINKGNIVFYKNTNIGDGIFRVIGFNTYGSSISVHGCEYGDIEGAMFGFWRHEDNFIGCSFDEIFEDVEDVEFVIVGTYDKKHKESVKLTSEQWEVVNGALEDYCLRLCKDGEHDYLKTVADTQKVLLDELGLCE